MNLKYAHTIIGIKYRTEIFVSVRFKYCETLVNFKTGLLCGNSTSSLHTSTLHVHKATVKKGL